MQAAPQPDTALGDAVLSPEAVLSIVRRHVADAQRVTAVDESGRKGRAYLIDDAIILKTRRPVRLRARLVEEFETDPIKEAFFLACMGRDPALPTPRLLGSGDVDGLAYVCMTRVAGVPLRAAGLSAQQRARALRDLGRTLRRLHALPQRPIADSGLFPDEDQGAALNDRLASLCDRIVAAMATLPQEAQMSLPVREVVDRALAALPVTEPRAALHSNPAPEHVFVDPATGALTGLIDFGDAYISHPALDLRPWRDPADAEAVMAGYTEAGPVDEAFLTTWRVGMIIGELAGLLRRREPPARAEATIRRLLGEL